MWILPPPLSSVFAQDTPVSNLASSELLADRAASSLIQRSKPSPSKTWQQRFKRGSFPLLQSGAICEVSREKRFTVWWTSFVADILAPRSVLPENGQGNTILGTSGPTSAPRSERSTLASFSSRTSKVTSRLDSPPSSAIWKKMVTRRRGDYSRRKKLALPTGGNGSSSWGTPRVTTNGGSPSPQCTGRGSRPEDRVAQNWPTPAARDYRTPYAETGLIRADGKPRLDLLPDAVRYETLFCRKAASGLSSPPTPAGPQDPGKGSTDGNPPAPGNSFFASSKNLHMQTVIYPGDIQ